MKLVRESLYNFYKTGDVKGSLNIGIRAKIKDWLDEMRVNNYIINEDGTIDVEGNVILIDKGITEFPPFIKFGKIKHFFYCESNRLTSLIGCPDVVGESFDCSSNELTSLEGAPKIVRGFFDCQYNKLTSLDGISKEIGRNFYCSGNSKKFTMKEVMEVCNVKGNIFL